MLITKVEDSYLTNMMPSEQLGGHEITEKKVIETNEPKPETTTMASMVRSLSRQLLEELNQPTHQHTQEERLKLLEDIDIVITE